MDKSLEKMSEMVEGPDKDKLGTCFIEELGLHPAHSNLISHSPSPSHYLLVLQIFKRPIAGQREREEGKEPKEHVSMNK